MSCISTTKAAKIATRKSITAKLNRIDPSVLHLCARATAAQVARIPEWNAAHSVALYMNLPNGELPTLPLLELAFSQGKTVYLPRIEPLSTNNDPPRYNGQKTCLHFLRVDSLQDALNLPPRGKYSIREPPLIANRDALPTKSPLDLIVLPGVAFTSEGGRLGHGAGYYDDFIKRYRSLHNLTPTLVGVGLPEQLLPVHSIQLEDHDEQLDYVVIADTTFSRFCK